jgi:NAD+ synthase (glutamine-hydrolysing)
MKVAVAQFNPTVGALEENTRRMLEWIGRARDLQADVVLFPELCVPGYPPRDLLDRPGFVKRVTAATDELVAASPAEIAVVFGTVGLTSRGPGLPLTNDAVVAQGGRELARVSKQLLPTYDVFDEARHFRPGASGTTLELAGRRVAITVCEDAWGESREMAGRYGPNPLESVLAGGADVLFNLSASPFTLSKWRRREAIFREVAERHRVTVVMANQVGANDELIFDGTSVVWSRDGRCLGRARSFAEELLIVDLDTEATAGHGVASAAAPTGPDAGALECAEAAAYAALVLGVRDYARKCGFRRAVLGLSGGIDSALTAVIAADALGARNVMTLAMPTRYSSPGSLADAAALAEGLGLAHRVVDIDPIFQAYIDALGSTLDWAGPVQNGDVTLENIQARVRGATLMAVSNRSGALVLTTGNKSEIAVGYCTLYGDMVGGLAVISDVPKTMVYRLAAYVNRDRERIPRASIEKAPSAELRPNQTDQDSLPPYAALDAILELYVEDQQTPAQIIAAGHDPARVARVVQLVVGAEYKRRQAAPGLILTRKAFGPGRRMPVAGRVEEAAE